MADAPVVVIGAGMAGTAAAFEAASAGVPVVLVHDRAGATALYSGALDLAPWSEVGVAAREELHAESATHSSLVNLLAGLGMRRLGGAAPGKPGLVATQAGLVRPALAADEALLDLAPLAGRRIALADIERDDWDAPSLAKMLAASRFATETRTTFLATPLRLLRTGHERRIAPYDFAALHDDRARRSSLVEAMKGAAQADAWLFGPWLGLELESIRELRAVLPTAIGETTSLMGGAAGARFERARDRLLAANHVSVRTGRAVRVAPRGTRWVVELAAESAGGGAGGPASELEARAVVLATGGVGAGGIAFTWGPPRAGRGFELPFEAPVTLGLDGEALGGGGALHGPMLEMIGLGALERVGVLCDGLGRPRGQNPGETGLYVAGDAVAGRPRTMLAAALSGIAAGNVAARG